MPWGIRASRLTYETSEISYLPWLPTSIEDLLTLKDGAAHGVGRLQRKKYDFLLDGLFSRVCLSDKGPGPKSLSIGKLSCIFHHMKSIWKRIPLPLYAKKGQTKRSKVPLLTSLLSCRTLSLHSSITGLGKEISFHPTRNIVREEQIPKPSHAFRWSTTKKIDIYIILLHYSYRLDWVKLSGGNHRFSINHASTR